MAINNTVAIADAEHTVSSAALALWQFTALDNDTSEEARKAFVSRASILRLTASSAVRYRYTGEAPAVDEGHVLPSGETLEFIGAQNIDQFRIIRDGSTDAVVFITLEE